MGDKFKIVLERLLFLESGGKERPRNFRPEGKAALCSPLAEIIKTLAK